MPPVVPIHILGVPIHPVTLADVLARVETYMTEDRPRHLITANSLMILSAQENPELSRAFREADLMIPDSAGVAWAARRRKRPLPERVPGIDLMDLLCARAAERGWKVFFLGAAPGVARTAADHLSARHLGLRVVGAEQGYFPPDMDERVAERVAAAAPDLLFVAFGAPRQELWIHRRLDRLACKVAMGVGGSFDVFAGRLRRAPPWMRAAGLEWLYRLLQEPRRARRMAGLPVFLWKALRERPGQPPEPR